MAELIANVIQAASRMSLRDEVLATSGERGIRTPEGLLTLTRFPGVRLKPLIHLSGNPQW